MSLFWWCLLFAASSLLCWWVLRRGGAEWLEGWPAGLLIDLRASLWNAEQIKLYVGLIWLLHAGWFVLGLFAPGLRGFD